MQSNTERTPMNMPKKPLTLLLVALIVMLSTTSYAHQKGIDLRASIDAIVQEIVAAEPTREHAPRLIALGQGQGRAELSTGDPAPFSGVLLSAEALAMIAQDRDALQAQVAALEGEVAELRGQADDLQRERDYENERAEMFKAECGGGGNSPARTLMLLGIGVSAGACSVALASQSSSRIEVFLDPANR